MCQLYICNVVLISSLILFKMMRQMSATSGKSDLLDVPGGSPVTHTDAMASPKLATRSSSLRRSKRIGSIRSLKNAAADGYILGMDQSTEVCVTLNIHLSTYFSFMSPLSYA